MRRALDEAAKGRGSVEPNPMVGAVVVQGEHLVSIGHHSRFGGHHAEVAALASAGEAARGATLYVTLEPCSHHGKTPPCVDAVLKAGVARVVAAHRDPFPKVAGGGFARLMEAGVEVTVGVLSEEAASLNAPYLKRVTAGRPYVIAKWAMTLDGKTAVAIGDSRWISSDESRALVHELRGRVDAIVVGIGTVLIDDPQLTARPPGPRVARRVVLDTRARLPLNSYLAQTARDVETIVVVGDDAAVDAVARLQDVGCEVLKFSGDYRSRIGSLLDEFGSRSLTNILVEGGGLVLGSFLDIGEIDEVDVYIAPLIEGGDHSRTPIRGQGRSLMDLATRVRKPHRSLVGEFDVRVQGEFPSPWRHRLHSLIEGGCDPS